MDFSSALDIPIDDQEQPVVLPRGTYTWQITKVPTQTTSKSGEWEIIEFPIVPVAADADVDPDELEEFGNLAGGANRLSFMFPLAEDRENDRKKTMKRLNKFLTQTLGQEAGAGVTTKELMANSVSQQFLAVAEWAEYEGEPVVNVKNYAPLD